VFLTCNDLLPSGELSTDMELSCKILEENHWEFIFIDLKKWEKLNYEDK
jgi:hypothetical protein